MTNNDIGMNIDTEFNVGDSVCYLSGDNIIHTSISKIIIEISYTDDSFLMVYKPFLAILPKLYVLRIFFQCEKNRIRTCITSLHTMR